MIVLGIDGGGTKTEAWLADAESGLILGRGSGGPSNQRAVGLEVALLNLSLSVQKAFESAVLAPGCVDAACLGLAGADRDSDREAIQKWAKDIALSRRILVVNDAMPLLYACDPVAESNDQLPSGDGQDGVGIALICGTGSMAIGRNSAGQVVRSGGWGYLLGDEGSAYWVGREGINSVTAMFDGRTNVTELANCVSDILQLSDPKQLIPAIYGATDSRAMIAKAAQAVFAAAANDDLAACRILEEGAIHLSCLVVSLARRLHLENPVRMVVTGGVILNQPLYRRQTEQQVTASGIAITDTFLVRHPVSGAVQMARQLLWHGLPGAILV